MENTKGQKAKAKRGENNYKINPAVGCSIAAVSAWGGCNRKYNKGKISKIVTTNSSTLSDELDI